MNLFPSNLLTNFHKSIKCFMCSMTQKMDSEEMLDAIKRFIPSLNNEKHKGQAGRIGIVGGSLEYTGAPYFSGISALKVGADLVHVFCPNSAAPVIKSYSPELIVHPLLDVPSSVEQIKPWIDRLHALVIGPGLGREQHIFDIVSEIISVAASKHIPLIIDADGLFLITQNLNLIKNYPLPGVILTPNKIEFERLYPKIKRETSNSTEEVQIDYAKLGNNVTILRKGSPDELYSKNIQFTWKSDVGGSGRRCGGQGDLLSGSIATFLHWALNNVQDIIDKHNNSYLAASLSCYAAARMVRLCNEKAFKDKGRSMLATDMIDHIHESFERLFGQ